MKKYNFRDYNQNQAMLLPPSFDELIPQTHPVRVVSGIIDRLDLDNLLDTYSNEGKPSFHPRLMLKVLVYGYLNNTYSTRKIEQACVTDIHFMWLTASQKPDHNTIARFRTSRLKGAIKDIFTMIVKMMVDGDYLDLKTIYTDGTQIEANANKYSFVWAKNVKRNKANIYANLEKLWKYAEKIARQELWEKPKSFEDLSVEQFTKQVEQLNEFLRNHKGAESSVKKKISWGAKHWPVKLSQYIEQELILAGRGSFSKTDPDSTFAPVKDDVQKKGPLKPQYNLQVSTQDQIITNYTLHSRIGDQITLKDHLEEFKRSYGFYPDRQVADAGYGSEENYQYLDQLGVEAYIKDNYFDSGKKSNSLTKTKDMFHPRNLYYNEDKDCYYCPMGQQMDYQGEHQEKSSRGYELTLSIYQAQNCNGCSMRSLCFKGDGNRRVKVSHRLNRLRQRARERLLSDEGVYHRKKRCWDVESVFGNIKWNKGFKRFLTRGIEKVEVEIGLLAIAHNLAKLYRVSL